MTRKIFRKLTSAWLTSWLCCAGLTAQSATAYAHESKPDNQVLEWNQIFIDTLIATNSPNAASPRLGAIVHTAIFDAYNGIEKRYSPIFVQPDAARGASRQAAVIAAAHTALVGLFPGRKVELDASFEASLAKLGTVGHGSRSRERAMAWQSRQRGIDWGNTVGQAVLDWRAEDGFSTLYPAFAGGPAIGQWRPVPPATAMSSQSMAFTEMFVLASNTQFRPAAPRGLTSRAYAEDFNDVKALGRKTGSTRTEDQTVLAPFWEGNASIHWNQAANQIASVECLSMSRTARLLAVLNIAMADTVFTIWSAKRANGEDPGVVTWRPATSLPMAELDGNPETTAEQDWTPLVTTPSHPEYPAGHPSLNGSAATVLLSVFGDRQTFTLTTAGLPNRTYYSITRARSDGNNARVWGGMHYPSSVAISDGVGRRIARYVDRNSMQRVKQH
jgi:hypothetical protein